MRILIIVMLLALPNAALAQEPNELKEAHREAARKYFEPFEEGLFLSGTVEQNGSAGTFEAYFLGEEWYVSKSFGELTYFGYGGESGYWLGSNFSLPYTIDPEDHPADSVMNLISSGSYMDDEWWEYFSFVSEDAGGYNFVFNPPDLPKVELVLYSDSEEPHYLQLMRLVVPFSEHDPTSLTHRSYVYYGELEDGRLYSIRETGRDVDQDGETVNFTEYLVEHYEKLTERPSQFDINTTRQPVGIASSSLTEPVVVEVDTSSGYFMIPLNFEGSDETFYFVLDTGATASLFTQEAAQAAKIESSLSINAHGHGTRTRLNAGLCTTASIGEAGGDAQAPLSGFPVTTIPDSSKSLLDTMKLYGASGIMGVSVLHQYVTTFDFPQNRIVLYPPSVFSEEQHISRPNLELWLDVESLVFCTGTINGQLKGDVVIDTGLQQELAILSETMELAGIELEKVDQGLHTVLGGVRKFDIVTVPLFELGPIPFVDAIATLTNDDRGDLSARGVLGFIGITLFQETRITLDLFNERMYIEDPGKIGVETPEAEEPDQETEPQNGDTDSATPDLRESEEG